MGYKVQWIQKASNARGTRHVTAPRISEFRTLIRNLTFGLVFMVTTILRAETPKNLWMEGTSYPVNGISNPYQLDPDELTQYQKKGMIHAQQYPVEITGILLPEKSITKVLGLPVMRSLFQWLGLSSYEAVKNNPLWFQPDNINPQLDFIGYSRIQRDGVTGFTVSCAMCHASPFFGKVIMGLSNRFPRANHFFIRGQKAARFYNPHWAEKLASQDSKSVEMLNQSAKNLNSVGLKMPLQLGLDTSLAQVALSLNKRENNPWADKSEFYEKYPRSDALEVFPGDSKPAVWWNVKYKNRWLLDGSVVSGNPIITNLLWNEIGRGTDLRVLDQWLVENQKVIQELTTAVYASQPPRIEDFIDEDQISKTQALKGEILYKNLCAKCHGEFEKNWSRPEFQNSAWKIQIQNYAVRYPEKTSVKNVGTDPWRYQMMQSLEKLNDLELSKKYGIRIQTQEGYVPPPLVGIWARYPYMHNNSMPNLCAVLSPSSERPTNYFAGPAENIKTDYDLKCGGYPSADQAPQHWKKDELYYRSQKPGLGKMGHDKKIFIKDGKNLLSAEDRRDLIQFLLTL